MYRVSLDWMWFMVPCGVFHRNRYSYLIAFAPHLSFMVVVLVLIMARIFVPRVGVSNLDIYSIKFEYASYKWNARGHFDIKKLDPNTVDIMFYILTRGILPCNQLGICRSRNKP